VLAQGEVHATGMRVGERQHAIDHDRSARALQQ
jgi:hypothetical protein